MNDGNHIKIHADTDGKDVAWIWENDLFRMFVDDVEWFENQAAAAEIKRLKEDAANNEGVMVALHEGYYEANQRIEEYEYEVKCLIEENEKLIHKNHYITDEQIDAAWSEDDVEYALKELGIKRCPNDVEAHYAENVDGEGQCSTCNGHEWVKK